MLEHLRFSSSSLFCLLALFERGGLPDHLVYTWYTGDERLVKSALNARILLS